MKFEPQAKLLWHGDRVKYWVETGRTKPILVEVSPTGYCNANCPWCFFNDKKSSDKIDKDIMLQTINEMPGVGIKAINWTGGGEPTIHPDFSEFVFLANSVGLQQGLFTNGYEEIPHQEMFEWIRISLTDKGYDVIKIPNVKFGICVNQTLNDYFVHIEKLCEEARNLGASYFQIRPALSGSYMAQPKLYVPNYLKKHETDTFKVYITDYKYAEAVKPKKYEYCYGYHFCPSINCRGKVAVCLYLSHKDEYILGDLEVEYLDAILKRFPKKVDVIEECQNCCKNHEINKILYNVSTLESVDFL